MSKNKRFTGTRGEALAAEWYRQQGYEVLGTNVMVGRNELDLICRTSQETVFVEVKTVTDDEYGDPIYKVDRQKCRAVIMATRLWLLGHPQGHRGVRFDIVTIDGSEFPPKIEHWPAAFTADDA
jgi:putative endonuclease